jgi:cobalt/nickel transport system permease protein
MRFTRPVYRITALFLVVSCIVHLAATRALAIHDGLSTLSINVISMGVVGSLAGFVVFRMLRSVRIHLAVAGFVAGLITDWVTYFTTSVVLASELKGNDLFLFRIAPVFVPAQLPPGVAEGAIAAGMVVLLYRKRPDLPVRIKVVKA